MPHDPRVKTSKHYFDHRGLNPMWCLLGAAILVACGLNLILDYWSHLDQLFSEALQNSRVTTSEPTTITNHYIRFWNI
jgi:hypothetical protein